MKLSETQKNTLLAVSKQVYFSYLALDFFKNKPLQIHQTSRTRLIEVGIADEDSKETLLSFAVRQFETRTAGTQTVIVAGMTYSLTIRHHNGKYTCRMDAQGDAVDTLKVPNELSDAESGHVLADKTFGLEQSADGRWLVSMDLSGHQIGGAGKIDLYRTHLVTLFNIITKIEKEEDITSLLVALATGSGKTYVQALWLHTLFLAKFNSVFAIPNKLIEQFRKDLNRLLPRSITQRIQTIRDQDEPEQTTERLNSLQQSETMLIASSELVLDNYYDNLHNASANRTCLIFDEQHLLMENERRRVRLLTLSQKFLSVFLTATPNRETYDISGKKPVAIMSSGQKEKAGQGQFPATQTVPCDSVYDIHARRPAAFGSRDYVRKQAEKLILHFDESIQQECSSAIRSIFEELPYVARRSEQEQTMRWRLQIPMAQKILCNVNDNEGLVNCCHYLQADYYNSDGVYHNGNFVERGSISSFFGIPNVERSTLEHHRTQKRREYLEQWQPDELDIIRPLLDKRLKDQLKSNMFHYLVEYVLSDISGQSMIEHNHLRKHSEQAFVQLIRRRYEYRDRDYFYRKLTTEIDEAGALEISSLLEDISSYLGELLRREHSAKVEILIGNWFLYDTKSMMTDDIWQFGPQFNAYAKRYLIMGLMSGMDEAETPVQDSKPFLGLIEDRYSLYEGAGMQASRAKRRQRTSIELLDDRACESSFRPNYVDITEDQADNYFRLGFSGIYVTNKKTEGFNDPNLHTIINSVEHSFDANNSPASLIQIIGRARGLDNTVKPHFFEGLGHKEQSSFDLSLLEKDDYYPELFAAQTRFERGYISVLGKQVAKDIIAWYHQHQEGDESIDTDHLKKKVLYLVASALRRLNIQATHRIHVSRAQLPKVIAYAMAELDKEIKRCKRPYQLSLFVRIVGTIINFVCECYFTILRIKPWLAMLWQMRTLTQEAPTENPVVERSRQADKLYMKIIQQAHFKDLIAQSWIAAEFKSWLVRKTNVTKSIVEKSIFSYLKPDIQAEVTTHLNTSVIPLFQKMVIPAKANLVRDVLQRFPGLLSFLQSHATTFSDLQTPRNDEDFAALMVDLFHKIPGLEQIQATDIVNYPSRMAQQEVWLRKPPIEMMNTTPELKDKLSIAIAEFLQGEFQTTYLGSLVNNRDRNTISAALSGDPEHVRAFTDRYLTWVGQHPDQASDFLLFFAQFKAFFGLRDVKLLSSQFMDELLPCMVNLYPFEERERLLGQITEAKLVDLFHREQANIMALNQQGDAKAVAHFFFTQLCTHVPVQLDLVQEENNAKVFFKTQTTSWTGIANIGRYLVDTASRKLSGSNLGLMSGQMQSLLLSPDCAKILSLILPFHHWKKLQALFQKEPGNLKKLAAKLVTHIDNPEDLTSDLIISEINDAFGLQLKSVNIYANEVMGVLRRFETTAKNCHQSLDLTLKTAFCQSNTCRDLVGDLFNPADAQILQTSLSNRQQAQEMVQSISRMGEDIDANQHLAIPYDHMILNNMRQTVPELTNIEFLHVRLERLQERIRAMRNQGLSALDNAKLADLLSEQVQPIVGHAQFSKLVNIYIGSLKLDDLSFIFETRNIADHREVAAQLLRFKELINKRDFVGFKQEFLQCPNDEAYDFEHSPLKSVLDNFAVLAEEIIRCHCYYQQHDEKGVQRSDTTKPGLYESLSDAMKEIRIPAFNSFMSYFSRKIFFVQAVRNGLPKAGEVYADSHANTIKNLERIRDQLLRPLWWSVNAYQFIYQILIGAKNLFLYLKDLMHSFINSIKAVLRRVLGNAPDLQDYVSNGIGVDFTESAFEAAQTINELEPLTRDQVAARDCPSDVVTRVEQKIRQLPSHRMRLFNAQQERDPIAAPQRNMRRFNMR